MKQFVFIYYRVRTVCMFVCVSYYKMYHNLTKIKKTLRNYIVTLLKRLVKVSTLQILFLSFVPYVPLRVSCKESVKRETPFQEPQIESNLYNVVTI